MPTYAFTRTRAQIIAKVLRKIGVCEPTGTPEPQDASVVAEALDLRLKELHGLGLLWWQIAAGATDVAITGGSASATITPTDFLFAVTMNLRIGTEDEPIEIIDHLTYQAIPDKASTGQPERVYINGSGCLFWPTPDANYTAKLTYQAVAADTEQGAAPDVRVECMRSLCTLVAGDVLDDFNAPEPKASRILGEAKGAIQTIRTLNTQRVDSSTVAPDWF